MFYDLLREGNEAHNTIRRLDEQAQEDRADLLEQDRGFILDYHRDLNQAQRELQEIHREMRQLQRAPELTPAQRREQIDQLQAEKNEILEELVTDIKRERRARERAGE